MLKCVFITIFLLIFSARQAIAITLTSSQTDYTTSADITTSGIGISSSFSGTSTSLNKIKNLNIITTGASGTVSGSYGIRTSGNFNQITNAASGSIFTTGSSGRGISITNNSIVINQGLISTLGTTSYGIYVGGNSNSITNSGSINTINTTSYGIYLAGDSNSATNSGSISTKVYGIYSDHNTNQISNSGTITTTSSSAAHGIFMSAGSSSTATALSHGIITNDGTINSSGNGIYNKDNYSVISNSGTITAGPSSSIYGIRNEGDNATITNSGTITAQNYAIYNSGSNAIINNSGILNGGVYIGSATLNILGGSISGEINGSGTGNVNIQSDFDQNSIFKDLDILTIAASKTFNANDEIGANRIILNNDSIFNVNFDSVLGIAISGAGTLNINGFMAATPSTIGVFGGALTNLNIAADAYFVSASDIYANNISLSGTLDFSYLNNLTIFGNVAGSGSATFDVGSQNQIVEGNFTLNDGDILAVALRDGGVGSITVTGLTTLSSSTKLAIDTSLGGAILGHTQYNLINSSNAVAKISDENISINNSNSNIFGLLKFTTEESVDGLVLNVDRLSPAQITDDKNAQNIYRNLSAISATSTGKLAQFQEYINSHDFTAAEISKTLKQLAPQSNKASLAAVNNSVFNAIATVENRIEKINLKDPCEFLPNGFWLQGLGSAAAQNQIASDEGYRINSFGFTFGSDKEVNDKTTIGAAFSLTKAAIKNLDSNKSNLLNSYQFSLYKAQDYDNFFLDSVASIALNQFTSHRNINSVNEVASARYMGQSYAAKVKIGFVRELQNGFDVIPETSLNFLRTNISGYSEKNADELNLDVKGVAANFLEARVGINFSHHSEISDELPEFKRFATILKLSYGRALINDAPTTKANFYNQETGFEQSISHVDNDSLRAGLEFSAYHFENSILSLQYGLEKKATFTSHFIALKIREEF